MMENVTRKHSCLRQEPNMQHREQILCTNEHSHRVLSHLHLILKA